MQVPNIEQNKPEWHLIRKGIKGDNERQTCQYITASSAPVCCLYKGRRMLEDYISFAQSEEYWEQREQIDTAPTRHGHDSEDLIRNFYTEMTGYRVEKGGFWRHKTIQYAACSPDGLVYSENKRDFDGLLEIKAPYGPLYSQAKYKRAYSQESIPGEYICQVQYQMWVVDKPWCDFVATTTDIQNPNQTKYSNSMFYRIFRNQQYIDWMQERVSYVWNCIHYNVQPHSDWFDEMERTKPPNIVLVNVADLMDFIE